MTGYFGPPTALFNNVPINTTYYIPNQFFISAITLGVTTTVTTTVNHNYVVGQLVRLLIPEANGSYQLNEITGYVISVPATNQVVLAINSSQNVSPFVTTSLANQPQIVAVGNVNSGQINANGLQNQNLFIPGSFQNISPN